MDNCIVDPSNDDGMGYVESPKQGATQGRGQQTEHSGR